MNKGFLMFSDEEPGLTILKDEPDDLTHLAPTAGDVCVPLADNPFLTEMFDEFILDENYCTLLPDDLNSLDSQSSKTSVNDPFMVYRNDYDICKSELSNSPQLLSPTLSKSPGGHSQVSLCSPGNSISEDDQLNSFISLQMDSEDEPELLTKAPYIPMSLTEDLPVLMSEDLMWGAMPDEKMSKLSPSTSVSPAPSISPPLLPSSTTSLNSSLAQLLCQKQQGNSKMAVKAHNHGGGLVNPSEVLEQMYIKGVTNHWSVDENSIQSCNKNDIISNKQINNFNNKLANIPNTNERAQKRLSTNGNQYDVFSKRSRNNEPKEKLSSELLNQLMSNTNTRQHSKNSRNNNDWTNSQRNQINKTTSHQPSDSVLMNLLDKQQPHSPPTFPVSIRNKHNNSKGPLPNISTLFGHRISSIEMNKREKLRRDSIRKNSFSLLDPESRTIPSLMDLSEQDYEVNAPVGTVLLQGYDLLNALETSDQIC